MNVGKGNEVDIFFEKGKNFGKTNSGNYYDVKKKFNMIKLSTFFKQFYNNKIFEV